MQGRSIFLALSSTLSLGREGKRVVRLIVVALAMMVVAIANVEFSALVTN